MTSSITRTAALLLACGLSAPAFAGVFTVTNLNDSGSGSLREAITLANANSDESLIRFATAGRIELSTELPRIFTSMTINGEQAVTLDGQGSTRIFRVGSDANVSGPGRDFAGDLTLNGLTVQNAFVAPSFSALDRNPTTSGGGVFLEKGRLTVHNSTFRENAAGNGGAIYALGGRGNQLTIEGSSFSSNDAHTSYGGAVYVDADQSWNPDGVKVSINQSTFTNNRGGFGAGIAVRDNDRDGGSFSVTNSQFTGNQANGGGAAYNRQTTILFDNVTMTDNDASFQINMPNPFDQSGGGLYFSRNSKATIRNSSLTGSDAGSGGGMIIGSGGDIKIEDSVISGNTAADGVRDGDGGGIYILGGTNGASVSLLRSTVEDNHAVNGFGGGINSADAEVKVIESLIANNTTGGGGGGIYVDRVNSRLILRNSTVTGNSTTGLLDLVQGLTEAGRGGGIYFITGKAIIESSTIANNTATEKGGGLLLGGDVNPDGLSTILNTIIADNTALFAPNIDSSRAVLDSLGYNLLDDSGEGLFGEALFDELTDLLNAIADLQALADNGGPTLTLALGLNSDAIDNGFTNQPTDQRGFDRPFGLGPDIGAYEFIPEPGTLVLLGLGGVFLGARRRRPFIPCSFTPSGRDTAT